MTDVNNLLLIMAKGISKMCKETPCDKCLFYPQHGLCYFDKFPAEWFDDEEAYDKDEGTLSYYVSVCTNCGKLSPVGDYCIWCGEKGTCLESGDANDK